MPFAANLKYIMQKSGLSNYKLAKELGCSQSSIKNWLDDNNIPHTKTRIKIAEHFGLTLAELDGDEPPTLPPAAAPEKDIKKDTAVSGDVSELSDLQREAWKAIRAMDDDTLRAFIMLARGKMTERG